MSASSELTVSPTPVGGGGGGGAPPSPSTASTSSGGSGSGAVGGEDVLGSLKGIGGAVGGGWGSGSLGKGSEGGGEGSRHSPSPSPLRGSPRGTPSLSRSHTLGPSASSLERERMEKPSALGRVFNPPKLERKHSSGDLHSRLKTRKILGVGETDNGDIHRSKISQVLGHNEHLYVKLPRGFWTAHVIMGVTVTIEAALLLLAPSWASSFGVMPPLDEDDDTSSSRMAGAALAGLCVFVWSLLGTSDKHYARTMLLSMLTYHILAVCVAAADALTEEEGEENTGSHLAAVIGVRATMCLLCLAYFYSIAGYTPIRGQRPIGFQQHSHINKEQ